MKIFFIASGVPESGFLYDAIRSLDRLGHQVVLGCLSESPRRSASPRLRENCSMMVIQHWRSLSGVAMARSVFSSTPYSVSLFHKKEVLDEILMLVAHEHPDIVHTEGVECAFYGEEVRRIFDIQVILRLGDEKEMARRLSIKTTNPLARLFFAAETKKIKRYGLRVCPVFDRVLTVSREEQERLTAIDKSIRAEVIPSGDGKEGFSPEGYEKICRTLIGERWTGSDVPVTNS